MNKKTVTVDWLIKEFGFKAIVKHSNSLIYGHDIIPKYKTSDWSCSKIHYLNDFFDIPELADILSKDSLRTREIAPDENTPKDTQVWVRHGENGKWLKRYLSYVKGEMFICFSHGCTSWTYENTKIWNYCKLAEENNE